MNTFFCDEQMMNVLDDGTVLISGGTHGGGVFAFEGASHRPRRHQSHRQVRLRFDADGREARVRPRRPPRSRARAAPP